MKHVFFLVVFMDPKNLEHNVHNFVMLEEKGVRLTLYQTTKFWTRPNSKHLQTKT